MPEEETAMPREVIGLIPASGLATRLGPLPMSKEILPVRGLHRDPEDGAPPRPVCRYLLEAMRRAGIRRTFVIIRRGKWDVPECLGDGSDLDMHLGYLLMGLPYGAPYTLDQAFPFVRDATVALGFPDILFTPSSPYSRLLLHLEDTDADVILGLFPAAEPSSCDLVDSTPDGVVSRLEVKPASTCLTQTWGVAVWTPSFTTFLHEHLRVTLSDAAKEGEEGHEYQVGEVIQAALERGLRVEAVRVSDEPFLDIGTPGNLRRVQPTSRGGA
jgi:glucose-1-phosphate thymidylyltransferase